MTHYDAVLPFLKLHSQILEMGGDYRPLDITHIVGERLARACVTVELNMEPPAVIETRRTYTETRLGVLEDREVTTATLVHDGDDRHVTVTNEKWTQRRPGLKDKALKPVWDGADPVREYGNTRLTIMAGIQKNVGDLAARDREIVD